MPFFSWIRNQVRRAVVGGVFEGLAEVGLIEADGVKEERQGEAVQKAIADKPKQSRAS